MFSNKEFHNDRIKNNISLSINDNNNINNIIQTPQITYDDILNKINIHIQEQITKKIEPNTNNINLLKEQYQNIQSYQNNKNNQNIQSYQNNKNIQSYQNIQNNKNNQNIQSYQNIQNNQNNQNIQSYQNNKNNKSYQNNQKNENYINNKYFSKTTNNEPIILKPKNIEEYRKMIIEQMIINHNRKVYISNIKSKKLIMPIQNINIRPKIKNPIYNYSFNLMGT
jgi:hypothetical protein